MKQPGSRKLERLIALFAVAILLFSPPLIIMVDQLSSLRMSWLPLYLFIAWGTVIGLTAWLMEQRSGR
ncbi:alkaline shock response membrane anchor protein AmaP [Halomonas qinghailakensis]|uniref:Alkaline shock response membrane anchor protein AmaP n=2 Tax=Halomonas TaxID=2745 RepID=A0AA46TQ77_9GAMM|nr:MULTISPECIES: hypothetical protein [Halomonas]UYO74337.1 alkaline shock response membrane anchor protein AmaP [Halomonas sp. ZZQ-149]UYV17658.1 hypothetical protein K1Y77_09070 [Halomonas qaidamensis]